MNPTVQAEQATRRAQVVEALADAIATLERASPLHVAVDGLTGPTTRALADDVARALTDRGRRCRRVTLDAAACFTPLGRVRHDSSTALKVAYMRSNLEFLREAEQRDKWDPPSLFNHVRGGVMEMAADHMRRFGSEGRAW
jgi:hypothetical protein